MLEYEIYGEKKIIFTTPYYLSTPPPFSNNIVTVSEFALNNVIFSSEIKFIRFSQIFAEKT